MHLQINFFCLRNFTFVNSIHLYLYYSKCMNLNFWFCKLLLRTENTVVILKANIDGLNTNYQIVSLNSFNDKHDYGLPPQSGEFSFHLHESIMQKLINSYCYFKRVLRCYFIFVKNTLSPS